MKVALTQHAFRPTIRGLAAAVVVLASVVDPGVDAQTFRTTTDLVTVPLAVRHRERNQPLPGLTAADFRIYEDGVEQQVMLLDRERRLVSICVVLDTSPSMTPERRIPATRAIDTLREGLEPDDEMALLLFARELKLALPWTRISQTQPIPWERWQYSPGTALLDAMRQALAHVETASNPRSVIVVVSDGGENSSRISVPKLVATRRQSEILVYGFHTELTFVPLTHTALPGVDADKPGPGQQRFVPMGGGDGDALDNVVGDSGGTIYKLRQPADGVTAAHALIDELRNQYTIGYAPQKPSDGKYRRIRVETTRKDLTVRHRGGYLALAR